MHNNKALLKLLCQNEKLGSESNIKFLVSYPVSEDELCHLTDESYVSGFCSQSHLVHHYKKFMNIH